MSENETFHLERLKNGKRDSFRWILEKYHPKVYHYCFRFIRSKEVAEEITSDTFMKLWEKRSRIRTDAMIGGLLFKITKDFITDYLRRAAKNNQRREIFLKDYVQSLEPSFEDMLHFEESLTFAEKVISLLPPMQQRVFQMRYQQNMTNQEIARVLDISPNTVKVHLNRASKFIKKHLRKHSEIVFLVITHFLN